LAGVTEDHFAQRLRDALQEGQRPLAHLEELVTRVGVSRAELPQFAALLRAEGSSTVNLNAATPEALEALGLSELVAEQVCAGRDGGEGTEDDVVFTDPLKLGHDLGYLPSQAAVDQVMDLVANGLVAVASATFKIQATGITARHGIRRVVTATVERKTQQLPKVVRWDET